MNKSYVDKVKLFIEDVQDPERTFNFWHEFGYKFNVGCSGCEYQVEHCYCVSIHRRLRKAIK